MHFSHARLSAAFTTLLPILAASRPAGASHELQLGAGPSAVASTWRGDYGGGGTLRFGFLFGRVAGPDLQAWQTLSTVDSRVNTGLSLGLRGVIPLSGLRPFGRAFVIHQHEEGYVSVAEAPVGTAAGIGPGIRHRAGVGGALGLEIPLRRESQRTSFTFFSQANGIYLTNDLGPALYVGLDLGVGLDVLL